MLSLATNCYEGIGIITGYQGIILSLIIRVSCYYWLSEYHFIIDYQSIVLSLVIRASLLSLVIRASVLSLVISGYVSVTNGYQSISINHYKKY